MRPFRTCHPRPGKGWNISTTRGASPIKQRNCVRRSDALSPYRVIPTHASVRRQYDLPELRAPGAERRGGTHEPEVPHAPEPLPIPRDEVGPVRIEIARPGKQRPV